VHALLVMLIAAWVFIRVLRGIDPLNIPQSTPSGGVRQIGSSIRSLGSVNSMRR
jgi:hypothetical protein